MQLKYAVEILESYIHSKDIEVTVIFFGVSAKHFT